MDIESGKLKSAPKCKECKETLDGFTGNGHKPSDGDLNICAYCGTIGAYAKDCTEIIPLTTEELLDIRSKEPEMWKELMSFKKVADSVRKKMKGADIDMSLWDIGIEIK